MTQVKEWSNQELNRKLADLMGWTVKNYLVSNDPVYGGWFVPMFDLVSPSGKSLMTTDNEEDSWSYAPDYCTDPAASLEVQAKAIEVSADKYVSNLDAIINPVAIQDNWRNHEIARLLTASPRERAEAAYITLSSKQ